MSDIPTSRPPSSRPRRSGAARIALAVILVAAIATAGLYLARRQVAREVLVGWLDARGVRAQVDIQRFELNGVVARVRVGGEDDPEFSTERVEVDYRLRGFWSGRRLGVDVLRVRLIRPVLRAEWRDGTLSFGSLDRVVEELRKRPPEPDAAKPLILVEGARARVDSPYGAVALRGDARIEDAKLLRLNADLGPTSLRGDGVAAEVSGGRLTLTTRGDRVDLEMRMTAPRLAVGGEEARGLVLRLAGQAPYPDLERRRGDGALSLTLSARADEVHASEAAAAHKVETTAQFDGRATGWVDTLALTGPLRVSLAAERAEAGDARLSGLDAGFSGQARWARGDWRVQGTASGASRGAWRGLGAATAQDAPELAAMKRAAADFTVAAPAVALSAGAKTVRVALPSPVRIASANGVRARISAQGGRALYADGEGALAAELSGGGSPRLVVAVSRYRLGAKGLDAALAADAKGSFGPVRDGAARTRGDLILRDGRLTYAARGCAPVSAARVDLGENDVRSVAASLCPTGGALFSLTDGAWRLNGALNGVRGQAPFLEARVEDADVRLDARGRGEAVTLSAEVQRARLIDEAAAERFRPLDAIGEAALAGDRWTGRFSLSGAGGHALGAATLDHNGRTGAGGMRFDTGDLAFAQGGLQPAALSPLAAVIASPVTGQARFRGDIGWSEAGLTSRGELSVPHLDFRSPAGLVAGLSGDLTFTSLVPLVTAPGQRLKVERIDSLAPLTHASLDFQLLEEMLEITKGAVEVGGGRLELEPMRAPLTGKAFEGALKVDGVQLGDIVARSPFADRVTIDARVSGRLPFVLGPNGIRFINGKLEAVQPGRLSIRRTALRDVATEGGEAALADGPVPTPEETNTVTEFAFQALENLAFESLSAEVNSLPEGRLGVLFKIQGAHEPPQEQELKLGLGDLIRGDFMKRRLPLPSHTKVNLTLDTTLNLDQLLEDFAETQRVGSGPVQP